MSPEDRDRFDSLIEYVLELLPRAFHDLLDESPLIVDDRPSDEMLEELGLENAKLLCGLHTGIPSTQRSVEDPLVFPTQIHLFREGILAEAGGWRGDDEEERVVEEIWITLLHEIGHQFGLEEDDLADLGYE